MAYLPGPLAMQFSANLCGNALYQEAARWNMTDYILNIVLVLQYGRGTGNSILSTL